MTWSDDGTYSSCSLVSSPIFTRGRPQSGQGNSSGESSYSTRLRGRSSGSRCRPEPPVPPQLGDLRLRRLLGGRLSVVTGGVGEQAELAGIDALPPGAVLAAEQLLDLVLQLADSPLRLPDRLRLLADHLVAEVQVVGQRRDGLAHATIVRPTTTS
jgi:hypothetical protein